MEWRINKIEIENFKFFKEKFHLDIDRKNVLLYGENGSGKSSIYWSFYTVFQAYSKRKEQGQKYFNPGHDENLRNRYSNITDTSSIKISFDNGEGTNTSLTDSSETFYPDDENYKKFMRRTAMSSDFMNYKFLSCLFDFYNSQENEVFKYFEKEVMPCIDLDAQFYHLDGTPSSSNNSSVWWNYIKSAIDELPKNAVNINNYNMRDQKYHDYISLIDNFNLEMRNTLNMIEMQANSFLRNTFKIDARIKIYFQGAAFNTKIGAKKRDKILHYPKIYLNAEMVAPNIKDTSIIKHPKSFFNEAKITCMALSLRLAILERHPNTENSNSSLFIDDLLISLDMGLRKQVIPILLSYSNKFQMFIFTHDRAFYNLIESEISKQEEWIKYELYAPIENDQPQPQIYEKKSYLETAKYYFHHLQLPSCANTLRRACEEQLKRILPYNLQLKITCDESEIIILDLNSLIQKYNKFVNEIGMPNIAPHMDDNRKLILNPFSHDDIETPFYRSELDSLIKEIGDLTKIEKQILVNTDNIRNTLYELKVSNNGHESKMEILFLEKFYLYKYNNNYYFSNPIIEIKESTFQNYEVGRNKKLKAIYSFLYNKVSLNSRTAPFITNCIFNKETNTSLKDITLI